MIDLKNIVGRFAVTMKSFVAIITIKHICTSSTGKNQTHFVFLFLIIWEQFASADDDDIPVN